jgi:hypothetical protein
VVGDPRHQHDAHDARPGDRRQEAEDQEDTGTDLGEAGHPGVEDAGAHAQGLEPAGRARDLPPADDVVDPVGEEHAREDDPRHQEREVHGGWAQVAQDQVRQVRTSLAVGFIWPDAA